MRMTDKMKLDFIERGYLKIPRAAPADKVAAAVRIINRQLGEKRGGETTPENVSFFSDMFHAPELMALVLETSLWAAVEALIGVGMVERPQAEVTLGFPNADASVMFNGKELHIDGFPDKGRYQETYTLNAGVFLSDVPGPFMGNFKVLPGSHLWVAGHARRHGHEGINRILGELREPAPRQLTVKAGDAVLCHYNLVHAREWNSSANIRYAVFFRIKRVGHLSHWQRALCEPWLEWDGLKGLRRLARVPC